MEAHKFPFSPLQKKKKKKRNIPNLGFIDQI